MADNQDHHTMEGPESPSRRKWGSSARHKERSSISKFSASPPASPNTMLEEQRKMQWTCAQCKYQNANPDGKMCALCGFKRNERAPNSAVKSLYMPPMGGPLATDKQANEATPPVVPGHVSEEDESVKTLPTSNLDELPHTNTTPAVNEGSPFPQDLLENREEQAPDPSTLESGERNQSGTSSSTSSTSDDGNNDNGDGLWHEKVLTPATTSMSASKNNNKDGSSSYEPYLWCCSKRVAVSSGLVLIIMAICFTIVAILSAPGGSSGGLDSVSGENVSDPPIFGGGGTPTSPPGTPPSPPGTAPTPSLPPAPEPVDLVLLGQGSITSGESNVGGSFGSTLAMSQDGKTIAIGAPLGKAPDVGEDEEELRPGVVQVHRLIGDDWIQIGQDLLGSNHQDRLGTAVAVSDDGSTVAIGAPSYSKNEENGGIVLVFRYDNEDNIWIPLGNDDDIEGANRGERLGSRLSLSFDGQRLAVAAHGFVQVYNYEPDKERWKEYGGAIESDERSTGSWTTSLSGDGNAVAVGAPGTSPGNAVVFDYDEEGEEWIPRGQDLTVFFDVEETNETSLAPSVSLSGNGNIVAVRAALNITNMEASPILVFSYDVSQNWTVLGDDTINSNIGPEDSNPNAPNTVTLSSDGDWLVATGSPAPLVFLFDNGSWHLVVEEFQNADEVSVDTISLSGDAQVVAIGDLVQGDVVVYEIQ